MLQGDKDNTCWETRHKDFYLGFELAQKINQVTETRHIQEG